MNVLFWNINKKDTFTNLIVEIVKEEAIDLVAFAELPKGKASYFETELRKANPSFKHLVPIVPNKVEIFYKDGVVDVANAYDGKRISVNKLHSSLLNEDFYIVFCHLQDSYSSDRQQLSGYARPIVKEIIEHEQLYKCKKTLVCGDFNMDPFEQGMLEYDGFNAMQTTAIAKKCHRKIEGAKYHFFYNPMWGLYGDINGNDVPGTYYYAQNHPIQQYWHMLDQVIMRPEVISVFEKKQLKIITKGKNYNLLNRNNNISDKYSDHLPIKFSLNI